MNSELGGDSVVVHAEPDMTKFKRHTNETLFEVCDYLVPLVATFSRMLDVLFGGK